MAKGKWSRGEKFPIAQFTVQAFHKMNVCKCVENYKSKSVISMCEICALCVIVKTSQSSTVYGYFELKWKTKPMNAKYMYIHNIFIIGEWRW